MAKEVAPEVEPVVEVEPHVVTHLDRDLNDPRKQGDTPQLPSLDD